MKKMIVCVFLVGCGAKRLTEGERMRIRGMLHDGSVRLEYGKADEALRIAESTLGEIAKYPREARLKQEALDLKRGSELEVATRAADQAIRSGQLERAKKLLQDAIEKYPEDRGARGNLAEVERRIAEARLNRAVKEAESKGEFGKALDLLSEEYARLAEPEGGPAWMKKILSVASEGPAEREEARRKAESMGEVTDLGSKDLHKRGMYWAKSGDLQKAARDLRAASRSEGFANLERYERAELLRDLARVLGASGDLEAALKEADEALLIGKEAERIFALKGAILSGLEREREAVEEMRKAVRILFKRR